MPMYDIKSFENAGVPLTKNVIKYGNAVDQNGNIIRGNPEN